MKHVYSAVLPLVLLFLAFFSTPQAFAFYTAQETGELLKINQMQFATELQFVTSGDEGVNFIGRFDKGLSDEANLRFVAGTGTTNFELGGFFKWVPIPDLETQPAFGLTFGAQYAQYDGKNEIALRVIPFVSKTYDTDNGQFTPFISTPVGTRNYDDRTSSPVFLVLGSRYKHPDFDTCAFSAELGFDLNDAFSYVSIGAIFPAFE